MRVLCVVCRHYNTTPFANMSLKCINARGAMQALFSQHLLRGETKQPYYVTVVIAIEIEQNETFAFIKHQEIIRHSITNNKFYSLLCNLSI